MSMICKVCSHPKRLDIDRKLVSGISSMGKIAREYDIHYQSVYRHRQKHLSRQLTQAKKTRDLFVSQNMYGLIEDLFKSSKTILDKTKDDPKRYNIALKAQAESRRTLEFMLEVMVSIREIQNDEKQQEREKRSEGFDLSRLTFPEVKQLRRLLAKAEGKEQGRRTDLERKAKKRKDKGSPLRGETLITEPDQIKPLERIRMEPEKPIDEFDQMRNKLGISNKPEMVKPAQSNPWVSV